MPRKGPITDATNALQTALEEAPAGAKPSYEIWSRIQAAQADLHAALQRRYGKEWTEVKIAARTDALLSEATAVIRRGFAKVIPAREVPLRSQRSFEEDPRLTPAEFDERARAAEHRVMNARELRNIALIRSELLKQYNVWVHVPEETLRAMSGDDEEKFQKYCAMRDMARSLVDQSPDQYCFIDAWNAHPTHRLPGPQG